MSALTQLRDHCRRMASGPPGEHPPEPERALWTQLADEIDAYLAGDLDEAPDHIEQDGFDFGGTT